VVVVAGAVVVVVVVAGAVVVVETRGATHRGCPGFFSHNCAGAAPAAGADGAKTTESEMTKVASMKTVPDFCRMSCSPDSTYSDSSETPGTP
jgi:hypothetical protein